MDRSLLDLGGGAALCVSQFTLYGDTRRGLRPSFTEAAEPSAPARLYDLFCRSTSGGERGGGPDGAVRRTNVGGLRTRGP